MAGKWSGSTTRSKSTTSSIPTLNTKCSLRTGFSTRNPITRSSFPRPNVRTDAAPCLFTWLSSSPSSGLYRQPDARGPAYPCPAANLRVLRSALLLNPLSPGAQLARNFFCWAARVQLQKTRGQLHPTAQQPNVILNVGGKKTTLAPGQGVLLSEVDFFPQHDFARRSLVAHSHGAHSGRPTAAGNR